MDSICIDLWENVKAKELLKAIPKNLACMFCIFFSAAELSASWQHNTALTGAAGKETPENQSKKT
jgi:hypothetical protein